MKVFLYTVLFSSVTLAGEFARLEIGTNSLSDYQYVRPSPGGSGEEVFDSLCRKTPPGCPLDVQEGRVAACAVSPSYEEVSPVLEIKWKRTPLEANKERVEIEDVYLVDNGSKKNMLKVNAKGKIIVWKWDGFVQDSLARFLRERESDRANVSKRMKGFDFFVQGTLKHELTHVEEHYIPFYKKIENLYNETDFREWVESEWILKKEEPPPMKQVVSRIQSRLQKELVKIRADRQRVIDGFHSEQGKYQNDWVSCACAGNMDACARMFPFHSRK